MSSEIDGEENLWKSTEFNHTEQTQEPYKRVLLRPIKTKLNGCKCLQIYDATTQPNGQVTNESDNEKQRRTNAGNDSDDDGRRSINVDDINPIDAYYQDISLFCLQKQTPLRKWAIRLTLWPYFERITMTVILLNCITLGLYDPSDKFCTSQKCNVLESLETFIYIYFVLEMIVKIIAFGFFGRLGYIAETWNRLDLFIVLAGTFELIYGDGEFLSSVRAVRVLRPLRAINRVPSIRILVTLLLDTLPMLANVFVLCVLMLMVFSIIGVQLWQGILRNRCYLDLPLNSSSYLPNDTSEYFIPSDGDPWSFICSPPGGNGELQCSNNEIKKHYMSNQECLLTFDDYINRTFVNSTFTNQTSCIDWNLYYTKCKPQTGNPHWGAISFDNTGIAFIAIFQSITLEGWSDIMYFLQDAYSSWVWVYFVALIVLGAYFLTNLCLVVVATQFSETRQRESALMDAARLRSKLLGSSTTFTISESGNKGCYNQILSILHYYFKRTLRRMTTRKTRKNKKKKDKLLLKKNKNHKRNPDGNSFHFHHHHHRHIHHHHLHVCPAVETNQNTLNPVDANNCTTLCNATRLPIMAAQPKICIEQALSCDGDSLNNLKTIPINGTSLILPENTVLLRHSGSISNTLNPQPQSTTVQLFPSLTKLHKPSNEYLSSVKVNDVIGDVQNADLYKSNGSYRSINQPSCCDPQLSVEEMRCYEKKADCMQDYESDESSYLSDDDDDDDNDGNDEANENKTKNSLFHSTRMQVKNCCDSNFFKFFIMLAIFLNTATMGMEHFGQPALMTKVLDIFNTTFTVIFALEMMLKLTGYGFYGYIKDAFNLFDAIIVIISIVELAGNNQGGVSVLRTFRLMRVFKLVRFLPTLQKQIQVMLDTLDSVMTFLGLLAIFIFTSAILGMHLFGEKLKDSEGESVRHNFDNLMWSLITVFQVLTQEDWNQILYDAMHSTTKWASIYFIFLMIIGNYILFNLLVAILVEGFSTETEGILSSPLKSPVLISRGNSNDLKQVVAKNYSKNQRQSASKSLPNITVVLYEDEKEIDREERSNKVDNLKKASSESVLNRRVRFNTCTKYTFPVSPKSINEAKVDSVKIISKTSTGKTKWCCQTRKDYSLFIFSPKNKCRVQTQNLVFNPWFDNVILFFILLNCIIMALERPDIHPDSTERKVIDYSNHVFTAVFFIEMCIKIFANGFCYGDELTYLKNNWNRVDFILVIISLVDLTVTYVTDSKNGVLGMLKVFRAFRTLRPLRVISRAPGLKIVVETLIASLAPIGNLVVVAMVFFTIFGILGVQLFKGSFYYCNNPESFSGEIFNKTDCLDAGYEWVNKKYNFDNLAQALFTLFVFATKDGWVQLMYDGIDAVGVNLQPKKNHNPWAFLYFVSFLLLAGFVVINMVVGVIIDNFQKCRVMVENEMNETDKKNFHHITNDEEDKHSGSNQPTIPINHNNIPSTPHSHDISSKKVRKKITILPASRMVHSLRSKPPTSSHHHYVKMRYDVPPNLDDYSTFRRQLYNVVSHYKFDLVIAVIIGLNVVFMALEFYQMPKELFLFLRIMNYIFTAIFILEAIVKIYGFGPRTFFSQRWNQLDVLIVVLSILGIVFEELNSSLPNPTIIRIMRVLRIARVLKILKAAAGIQKLLNCVSESLPQVGNLTMLFLLIFFIFSALGIELFGGLDCTLDSCYGLSRHAHFKNFGCALLTLFRISTGDNWSGILKDCINTKLCREKCDMMPYVAPLYFAVFVLASQFVLVNVVVAVLMKQLEDAKLPVDDNYASSNLKMQEDDSESKTSALHNNETDLMLMNYEKDLSKGYSTIGNSDVTSQNKSLELLTCRVGSQCNSESRSSVHSNNVQGKVYLDVPEDNTVELLSNGIKEMSKSTNSLSSNSQLKTQNSLDHSSKVNIENTILDYELLNKANSTDNRQDFMRNSCV